MVMDQAVVNYREFLQLYNQMTEKCFNNCINNFYSGRLDEQEYNCAEKCAAKFVNFNHRLTPAFVEIQSTLMNKRLKELEDKTAKDSSIVTSEDSSSSSSNILSDNVSLTPEIRSD